MARVVRGVRPYGVGRRARCSGMDVLLRAWAASGRAATQRAIPGGMDVKARRPRGFCRGRDWRGLAWMRAVYTAMVSRPAAAGAGVREPNAPKKRRRTAAVPSAS